MAKFTLTDVTTATWKTLSDPPDGKATPPEASAYCLKDVKVCKKDVSDRVLNKPYYARNSSWTPGKLPSITKPISWPFLQRPLFKKSATATYQVFNLAFVASPPAGYSVKIYKVTYSKAGVPPEFLAVAFPMDLDVSEPPSFLVHFKHIPGQGVTTLFTHFNPLGYDWLHYDIWNWFVYNDATLPNGTRVVDMPFHSPQQFSFGFPYQLRQVKKPYVVVLPQISRTFDGTRLRDYQLYSASLLREMLVAVQKDILEIKDDKLAHVAISANSSGCNVLTTFLADNLKAMKTDKVAAEFMTNEFNELFVLDPPGGFGDAMVTSLAGWRKLKGTRSGHKGKCVRFYTRSHTKKFADLTDNGKDPFTAGTHGLWESSDKRTTLAYLPYDKWGDDIWQRTYDEHQPNGTLSVSNFAFVHHVIPAMFVADAAAVSLYV